MLKKFIPVVLLLAVVVTGWLAYYYSDKQVIKRQLVAAAGELNKEGQETAVQVALKMHNVQDILAQSCQVVIPDRNYDESVERDLIIRYLIYHRSLYTGIKVALEDLSVDIPVKKRALVQSTVFLQRMGTDQSAPVEERSRVELVLEKGEKKWLLNKITLPESLIK